MQDHIMPIFMILVLLPWSFTRRNGGFHMVPMNDRWSVWTIISMIWYNVENYKLSWNIFTAFFLRKHEEPSSPKILNICFHIARPPFIMTNVLYCLPFYDIISLRYHNQYVFFFNLNPRISQQTRTWCWRHLCGWWGASWVWSSGDPLVGVRTAGRRYVDTSQTIFSDAFSRMKSFVFCLKFHWNLFLMDQWTIIQYWFR